MYSQIETPTSFDRELYSCDIEMTASLVDVEEEMVRVAEKWAPVSQRQEWQDSHPGIKPRRMFRVPKRQLTQRKIQRLQVSTFLQHFFKSNYRRRYGCVSSVYNFFSLQFLDIILRNQLTGVIFVIATEWYSDGEHFSCTPPQKKNAMIGFLWLIGDWYVQNMPICWC